MRHMLLLALALLAWLPSRAATLEQVARLLAQPAQPAKPSKQAQKPGTTEGWTRLDALPGMAWQHAGVKRTPMGHTRHGTLQVHGLGKVTAFFNGSLKEPQSASLLLAQGIDKAQFNATVRRLMPAVQVKPVRAGCKDDSDIGGSAVFQLHLAGARPAYLMLMSGTSKAGLETELAIAAQLPAAWSCPA